MGKMKELFIQQMNEQISEHFNNMSDAEYQDWLNSQKPATQYDKESEHDAWWNSLTNHQKQKLFEDQEAMEKEHIELSIEEMNHDFGFGV